MRSNVAVYIILLFFLISTMQVTSEIADNSLINNKKTIFTAKAPKPIGPYSQAVVVGDFIFVSGQIALDSATGKIISGNVVDETKLIMQNISNILESAGAELKDIVKTSIFMTDLNDFSKVNEIYGGYFTGDYPARETVQVAGLSKGAKIEISIIAINPKQKSKKK